MLSNCVNLPATSLDNFMLHIILCFRESVFELLSMIQL